MKRKKLESYNNGEKLVCIYIWWSGPGVFTRLRGISKGIVEIVVLWS